MKYFINSCTDPYRNMAFDEWCLEHGPDEPVFYLWRNRPSVIVGFNQVAGNEVNLDYLREHGILLVRRVTGAFSSLLSLAICSSGFNASLTSVLTSFNGA